MWYRSGCHSCHYCHPECSVAVITVTPSVLLLSPLLPLMSNWLWHYYCYYHYCHCCQCCHPDCPLSLSALSLLQYSPSIYHQVWGRQGNLSGYYGGTSGIFPCTVLYSVLYCTMYCTWFVGISDYIGVASGAFRSKLLLLEYSLLYWTLYSELHIATMDGHQVHITVLNSMLHPLPQNCICVLLCPESVLYSPLSREPSWEA